MRGRLIFRFPPSTFVSLIAAIQAHLKLASVEYRHGYYQSITLPRPVSKARRDPSTLAALVGHQRVYIKVLKDLRPYLEMANIHCLYALVA